VKERESEIDSSFFSLSNVHNNKNPFQNILWEQKKVFLFFYVSDLLQ